MSARAQFSGCVLVAVLAACSAKTASTSGTVASASSCSSDAPLSGAPYDRTKSRFAFGSTPTEERDTGGLVRWVGSDGAIAIGPDGSEGGAMNGGAPEMSLPDWSSDPAKAAAHASDYWLSMGVESCQLTGAGIDSSGGGSGSSDGGSTTYVGSSTVAFARSVGGIPVEESLAVTRFDSHDQTTQEAFYWPEIPADVVSAAFALKAQLADPAALAAYKAKLPSDAQGQGRIVIHHSRAGSMSAFQSAATYEVTQANSLGDGGALNFDASGKLVATIW